MTSRKILLRRDSTINWETIDPILDNGELGLELVGTGERKIKIGDGSSSWNNLSYIVSDSIIQDIEDLLNVTTSSPQNNQVLTFQDGYWINANSQLYTDEQAQDTVGGILRDSSTIDFLYSDSEGYIEASIKYSDSTLDVGLTGLKVKDGVFASPSHNHSLDSLSNVTTLEVSNDQLLKWSTSSSKWINFSPNFVSDISDLSDVEVINPSEGQILTYKDGYWNNQVASQTYTDEQAQDAVGGIFTDSDSINFIYNDSTPSITAEIVEGYISHQNISGAGTNTHSQIDSHLSSISDPHGGSMTVTTKVITPKVENSDTLTLTSTGGNVSITSGSSTGTITIASGSSIVMGNELDDMSIASAGGLSVTSPTSTFSGKLIVNGNDPTEFAAQKIVLNRLENQSFVTSGKASIEIERGTGTNYELAFQESDDTFRVGFLNETRAVVVRGENLTSSGITYWADGYLATDTLTISTTSSHISSSSNPHSVTHSQLSDKGTNTHNQIDSHLSATSDPHGQSMTITTKLTVPTVENSGDIYLNANSAVGDSTIYIQNLDGVNKAGLNIEGYTYIGGGATIAGNLIVNGTTITQNATTVNVADNQLLLNYGESGTGVTAGKSGIEVERGGLTNYEFVFDETTDNFKVGMIGDTQAVATRGDIPDDGGIAYWNDGYKRFDTDSDFTKTTISGHISSTSNPHSVSASQVGLGSVDNVQQLPMSYLDTDGYFVANSDTKIASQKAAKVYVDGYISKVKKQSIVNSIIFG